MNAVLQCACPSRTLCRRTCRRCHRSTSWPDIEACQALEYWTHLRRRGLCSDEVLQKKCNVFVQQSFSHRVKSGEDTVPAFVNRTSWKPDAKAVKNASIRISEIRIHVNLLRQSGPDYLVVPEGQKGQPVGKHKIQFPYWVRGILLGHQLKVGIWPPYRYEGF